MKFHFRHQNITTVLLLLCIGLSSICSCTEKPDDEVKLPENMEETIEFADPSMKRICILAYDDNNDGELSFEEAAKVTDLSLLKNLMVAGVTSFDEFKYFINVKEIPEETFKGTSLSKITLPENLTVIKTGAFSGCKLTTITIPDKVLTLENAVFMDCKELKSVSLPKNLTSLSTTFRGCTKLETIDIPESVTELNGTFCNCSNLRNVVLPGNVSVIGRYTFTGCKKLTSIKIPDKVSSLMEVFTGCESLTSVEIPGNVKSLYCTFCECPNISEVILHEGVENIYSSFQGMNLTTVTLPSTLQDMTLAFCRNMNLRTIYSKAKSAPRFGPNYNSSDSPLKFIENVKITVYVPAGSKKSYESAWWSILSAPDGPQLELVEYDFENNVSIR